jgi:hypothetical protein
VVMKRRADMVDVLLPTLQPAAVLGDGYRRGAASAGDAPRHRG